MHHPSRALATIALAIVGAVLAQSVVPCSSTTVVDAMGFWSDPDGDVALDAAVTAALSTAIASVRGVTVTDESSLVERVRTERRDGVLTTERSSDHTVTIAARLAGSGVDFRVIEIIEADQHGVTGVRVRATVCLDPRLAMTLTGRGSGVDPQMLAAALFAKVAPHARSLGWSLAPDNLSATDVHHRYGDAVVATGATALLSGAVVGEILEETDLLVSYELVITFTLSDVSSGAILISDGMLSARGVGYSVGAAMTSAMDHLTAELSRAVTLALVPVEAVPVATFTFAPIRRAGSRHTIVDHLAALPGVAAIDRADLNDEALTVVAHITSDACAIAARLTDWRRLRLGLEVCDDLGATLRVHRE